MLEEEVRHKKIDVDNLKAKATEMLVSDHQSNVASQAQKILTKFDLLAERIQVRLIIIVKEMPVLSSTFILCR